MVTRVYTHPDHRKKGHAGKLLVQVLADADKEGISLVLDIYASGQMNNAALKAWYEKHGFIEQSVGMMQGLYLRKPLEAR
jgi:ribosomal protein S18 acetylase RimI-like enzyme